MTRISKKDRNKRCPRKPRYGALKTGPKKDKLPKGYKEHSNAYSSDAAIASMFIPKIP